MGVESTKIGFRCLAFSDQTNHRKVKCSLPWLLAVIRKTMVEVSFNHSFRANQCHHDITYLYYLGRGRRLHAYFVRCTTNSE